MSNHKYTENIFDESKRKFNKNVVKVTEQNLDNDSFESSEDKIKNNLAPGEKSNKSSFEESENKLNKGIFETTEQNLNENIFELSEQKFNENRFEIPELELDEHIFKVPRQKINRNIFDVSIQKHKENIFKMPEERQSERKIVNDLNEKCIENYNVDVLNERFIEDKSLDESDKKLIENNNLNTPVEKFNQDDTLPMLNNEFSHDSENKPLETLKQALDRATEIICLGSSTIDDSQRLSSKIFDDHCKMSTEDIKTCENLFENVATKIHNNDLESEIKSIEKYNFGENQDYGSKNIYSVKKPYTNAFDMSELRSQCDNEFDNPLNDDEKRENDDNLTLLLFSGKKHDKECNSCHHTTALARRRSLPAALGQLKAYTRMSVGKLPTVKAVSKKQLVDTFN